MDGIFVSLAYIIVYVLIFLGTYLLEGSGKKVAIFRHIIVFSFANVCLNIWELSLGPDALLTDFKTVAFIRTLEVIFATGSLISMFVYVEKYLEYKTRLFMYLKVVFVEINMIIAIAFTVNLAIPLPFLDTYGGTRLPDAAPFYTVGVSIGLILYVVAVLTSYRQLSAMHTFCFVGFALCGAIDPIISVNQYSFLFGIGELLGVILCSFFSQMRRKREHNIKLGQEWKIDTTVQKRKLEHRNERRKIIYLMSAGFVAIIALTLITTGLGILGTDATRSSAISGMIISLAVMLGIYMTIIDYRIGARYALVAFSFTLLNSSMALLVRGQVNAFAGLMQVITGVLAVLLIYTYLKKNDEENEIIITQAIATFAEMIDSRDSYTGGHSSRVSAYAGMIAEKMGYDAENVKRVRMIGLLHDCGKLGIDDDILKKKVNLTQEEYEIIKSHTTLGANMLVNFDFIEGMNAGALYHHERYDGKGYPQGIAGKDIPEIGRIIAVADVFDVMYGGRFYRSAVPVEEIINDLRKNSGSQLDPEITEIMISLIMNEREMFEKNL